MWGIPVHCAHVMHNHLITSFSRPNRLVKAVKARNMVKAIRRNDGTVEEAIQFV